MVLLSLRSWSKDDRILILYYSTSVLLKKKNKGVSMKKDHSVAANSNVALNATVSCLPAGKVRSRLNSLPSHYLLIES